MNNNRNRFFLTSPHSGEKVPEEVYWLKNLPEEILMFDIDRYVDQLYEPTANKLKIPFIKAQWHRYFSDANRLPDDVDQGSVIGSKHPKGKFLTGLIWQITSQGHKLLSEPISSELYSLLLEKYYSEFHTDVKKQYSSYFDQSNEPVYQLDLHSMPSQGTKIHRDPGEVRAEIVISDQNGQSASESYVNLIKEAYTKAGFKIAYNWPYIGGRVTETYGQPTKNQHCVQVELRRNLYMNEITKKMNERDFLSLKSKLDAAICFIYENIDHV